MTIILYAALACAVVALAVYWHARRRLRQFEHAERISVQTATTFNTRTGIRELLLPRTGDPRSS